MIFWWEGIQRAVESKIQTDRGGEAGFILMRYCEDDGAMMHLNDNQKDVVRDWIEAGLALSEIQSKLNTEFGISGTYMELRFLVGDLGVMPKDPEPSERSKENHETIELAAKSERQSGVSIKVDSIARAGTLASGQATFSDGQSARWTLDSLGRLGFSPNEAGYKPSQEDWMAFQMQLQKALSGPRLGSASEV